MRKNAVSGIIYISYGVFWGGFKSGINGCRERRPPSPPTHEYAAGAGKPERGDLYFSNGAHGERTRLALGYIIPTC